MGGRVVVADDALEGSVAAGGNLFGAYGELEETSAVAIVPERCVVDCLVLEAALVFGLGVCWARRNRPILPEPSDAEQSTGGQGGGFGLADIGIKGLQGLSDAGGASVVAPEARTVADVLRRSCRRPAIANGSQDGLGVEGGARNRIVGSGTGGVEQAFGRANLVGQCRGSSAGRGAAARRAVVASGLGLGLAGAVGATALELAEGLVGIGGIAADVPIGGAELGVDGYGLGGERDGDGEEGGSGGGELHVGISIWFLLCW